MTLAKSPGPRPEGGKRASPAQRPSPAQRAAQAQRAAERPLSGSAPGPTTLCIDIGGTGIKMIALDARGKPLTERARMLTPKPSRPAAVLGVIRRMIAAQPRFDRVSVGFPGVVVDGVV